MTRKFLLVGNWKMHLNVSQSSLLLHRLQKEIRTHRTIEVVLAPSMLTLQPISLQVDRRKFRLAAQNAYFIDEGSFTGEVSCMMLRDLVHYVIVGHSERRIHLGEDLETIRNKVQAAIRNEISPILCVGETKEERRSGETKQVLHDQVATALSNVTSAEVPDVVIAYEPVWAIGGSSPAKPHEIEEAIRFVRLNVEELYGEKAAQRMRVLYGGSVAPEFVHGILSIEGVDGLLVGRESINPYSFAGIIEAAYRMQHEVNT